MKNKNANFPVRVMALAAAATAIWTASAPALRAEEAVGKVIIIEQSLEDFLNLAGRQFGVHMKLPRKFRGTIRNLELSPELEPMLRELSGKFAFDWYREGRTVHVSSRARSVSKMIYLGKLTYGGLKDALSKAGVAGEGYKMAHIPNSNSLLINGPPSLIAKIELLADGYNKNAQGLSIIRYGSGS
ncbi:MAG: hypothetical protein AAF441_05325 [Pseudomonadota bacterium]